MPGRFPSAQVADNLGLLYNPTTGAPLVEWNVQITVRGKHFDVPDSVEQRARRKLAWLENVPLLHDAIVEVDISHERAKDPRRRFVVRVLVNGGGIHLRAEEHASDVGPAVDEAAHSVIEQARRQKDRAASRSRVKGAKEALIGGEQTAEDEHDTNLPGKVKRFSMKPMTVREAVTEMEMLGHPFFVFQHADEDQLAVLYRREKGGYGMILPETP